MSQASQPPAIGHSAGTDPDNTDPTLLKDNSQLKTYRTKRFEYPDVRVFFRQHAKAAELPKTPAPLPLIVCVPGLGGSVVQFHQLLRSLVDMAPCLAIDWPGGGRSRYSVTSWDAYTPEALVELLDLIIEDHRDATANQGVVLIAHSMGTALAAQLANKKAPHATSISQHVVGVVAICPLSGPFPEEKSTLLKRLLWIPGWIFALWRAWDGVGGPQSASVSRFVGAGANLELREMQYRFNQQSRTPVWRRMAYGSLASYENGKPVGGVPSLETWANLDVPLYLIAGEDDHLTPPAEVQKITDAIPTSLETTQSTTDYEPSTAESTAASLTQSTATSATELTSTEPDDADDSGNEISTPRGTSQTFIPPQPRHPRPVVQSIIMPSPANHALLYMPRLSRALAGKISDFLAENITQRLSLAWQLQYLSREGKWDVKNLAKWRAVEPVSEIISAKGKPIFRAMKTLREADDLHNPAVFAEKWGAEIKDVIDISKDQPVYDPRGLHRGGVHYHKFPTVSKVPPEAHEVEAFVKFVDSLRETQKERAVAEEWEKPENCVIGVHCHYGFNRTGYFIVCYLVERCDFLVQDAIETFRRARPPSGIRHSHFLDRLCVRYNIETPAAQ